MRWIEMIFEINILNYKYKCFTYLPINSNYICFEYVFSNVVYLMESESKVKADALNNLFLAYMK